MFLVAVLLLLKASSSLQQLNIDNAKRSAPRIADAMCVGRSGALGEANFSWYDLCYGHPFLALVLPGDHRFT